MSNMTRDKNGGGNGSPISRSSQPPVPVGQGKQRKEMRADFLLNFSRPRSDQRPQPNNNPRRRGGYGSQGGRRNYAPAAFAKGRFVQSSFRLFVESMTQDVVEAACEADSLLDWQSVRRVDLLCEEHPKCPICLEESMVVPKITRCGHIYCAPCVMRYYMTLQDYNKKASQRCPVCNEQITPEDLTSVRLQMVPPLTDGSYLNFVLAHRKRDSTTVWLPQLCKADDDATVAEDDDADDVEVVGLRLPRETDRGWHLGRLLRLAPGEAGRLLNEEVEALRKYRPAAIAAGDTELLPSIDAAVVLLRSRQEQRGTGATSSASVASDSGAADSGPGWECRYVDIAEEFQGVGGRGRASGGRGSGGGRQSFGRGGEHSGGSGPSSAVASPVGAGAPQRVSLTLGEAEELQPLPDAQLQLEEYADDEAGPAQGDGEVDEFTEPGEQEGKVTPTASPSLRPASQASGGGSGIISHYQLADGRLVFLQPFFTRLLLHEHGGRWDKLPAELDGLRLERMQEQTITEETRKRHKFLSHLPVGSQISFAEVDLRNHLSKETKEHFAEDFAKRREQRKKEQLRAKKEERLSASRAQVEEEKYYRSLNRMHPSIVQNVPTKDDFAVDLHGRECLPVPDDQLSGEAASGVAANSGDANAAAEQEAAPTMADKIKERLAGKAKPKKASQRVASAGYNGVNDESQFPTLGGGRGSSGGAWGKGGRGAGSSAGSGGRGGAAGRGAEPAPSPASQFVPDSWEDDDEAAQGPALAAAPSTPMDEQPSFGQALEAALRRSTEAPSGSASSAPKVGGAATADVSAGTDAGGDAAAPAVGDDAAAPSNTETGKKKKGRAAKATTIRLFG